MPKHCLNLNDVVRVQDCLKITWKSRKRVSGIGKYLSNQYLVIVKLKNLPLIVSDVHNCVKHLFFAKMTKWTYPKITYVSCRYKEKNVSKEFIITKSNIS